MIPTIAAVKKAFSFYNKKYFNGQLPTPAFSTNCPKKYWACFETNDQMVTKFNKVIRYGYPCGTLHISSYYSRDEKDILNSLLHEMVHMYVLFVLRKKPLNPHGSDFMAKAQELNQDGWNIMKKNEMNDTDVLAYDGEKAVGWSDKYIQTPKKAQAAISEITRQFNDLLRRMDEVK